ncbi:MAG: hypothetical protein CL932_06050 [Deltaproteobacteria bacterium]|nr:hypothetical protein [Deltaproteobacteria bacterium]
MVEKASIQYQATFLKSEKLVKGQMRTSKKRWRQSEEKRYEKSWHKVMERKRAKVQLKKR